MHNGAGASATYDKTYHKISFFWKVLGRDWFNLSNNKEQIDRLLIHEFGHYYSSNHLSESYYDGLCKIGAKWIALISQGKI